jgi:hypothetical protein
LASPLLTTEVIRNVTPLPQLGSATTALYRLEYRLIRSHVSDCVPRNANAPPNVGVIVDGVPSSEHAGGLVDPDPLHAPNVIVTDPDPVPDPVPHPHNVKSTPVNVAVGHIPLLVDV